MDSKARSIALLPALTIYHNVIRIPLACLLSFEPTIRERVLTIHGIESSGGWQEDVARAFAPHFACKTIKYCWYQKSIFFVLAPRRTQTDGLAAGNRMLHQLCRYVVLQCFRNFNIYPLLVGWRS
jgi:hypothetical protein